MSFINNLLKSKYSRLVGVLVIVAIGTSAWALGSHYRAKPVPTNSSQNLNSGKICAANGSNCSSVSASTTPKASTAAPPTPNAASSSAPTPAPTTTGCDKKGEALAFSQLSSSEDQDAIKYGSITISPATESALIVANETIGFINIDLNTAYTSYIDFLQVLNCPAIAQAPTPYPLYPDPGNLSNGF